MSEFLDSLNPDELNKYQRNKRNWLMENKHRYDEITIKQYWDSLENNNINIIERAKKKDLYDFTHAEILEAINYAPTIKHGVKVSLLSTISSYEQWAVERGFNHVGNPCDTISIKDIKINMTAFKMSYMKLDAFYDFLETLESSYSDKMILVLARYGVKTDDMPYVKWDNVDRVKYLLNITHGYNKPLALPIDDMFLYCLDKTKAEEFYEFESVYERKYIDENGKEKKKEVVRQNHVDFMDYGYVLKLTSRIKNESETMFTNTIRNKVNTIAINNTTEDKKVKRPKVSDYNDSREYDLLFDKLESNGKVTRNDLREVLSIFEEKVTASKMSALKKNFELLSGIEIEQEMTKG